MNVSLPMFKCFICEKNEIKDEAWDLVSLKYIYGNVHREDFGCMKLCKRHLEYCEKRIPELEAALPKETEKILPPFIPKKVDPGKNYHEREAGEEG